MENPHWIVKTHTQYPAEVNIWIGIINYQLSAPYFFEKNLNAQRYFDFLTFFVIPALAVIFANDAGPDILHERLWFPQDG